MSCLIRMLSLFDDSVAVVDGKRVEYLFPAVDPSGQVSRFGRLAIAVR